MKQRQTSRTIKSIYKPQKIKYDLCKVDMLCIVNVLDSFIDVQQYDIVAANIMQYMFIAYL